MGKRIGIGAAILVIVLLALVGDIGWRRMRAKRLIENALRVKLGAVASEQYASLAKYSDEVIPTSDCRENCWTTFELHNFVLSKLHLARKAAVRVQVKSTANKVEKLYVTFGVEQSSPYEGLDGVRIYKVQTCDLPFKVLRGAGEGKHRSWMLFLTPDASNGQMKMAGSLNLSCLATRVGCNSSEEIAPDWEAMPDSRDRVSSQMCGFPL